MSLIKKLAGETALYGLSSIVGRFLNYLLVPLYTRTFLTGEYGVVSELYAYSGFLMVVLSYRLETAFFRYGTPVEDRDTAYATAFRSLWMSSAVFLALLLLLAQPVAGWLSYADHPEYIRWFALILFFDALTELPFARLRLERRPGRFVTGKLLNIGTNIALNLFWLVFCPWAAGQGMEWVHAVWSPSVGVGYVFLSNLIASAATLLYLVPVIMQAQKGRFDPTLWRAMLRYAGPLIVVGLAGIANEMLDRALLTRLLTGSVEDNRKALGVYAANYKLAMLITLFTQAYRYAAEPFFFRHAKGEDDMALQAKATKWFTIAAGAAMLVILLFIDQVKLFIGERFHDGLHVVPILLLANLFLGWYYNFSVWYRLHDRTATGARISLIGALITLLLNMWWVPLLGYAGSAWATLACYIYMAAATWWTGRAVHPVPYPLGRMTVYVMLVLALAGVDYAIRIATDWPMAAEITVQILGVLAYIALVWRLEKSDLRDLA